MARPDDVGGRAGDDTAGGGAGVSAAPGEDHRALCARRRHRHFLAAHGGADRARIRSAAGDRQSWRRREHRSAPRRWQLRSPTATPSAWWTAPSSPIRASTRRNCRTTPARDFVPVSLLSRTQLVLVVHPSSPYKTAQELIAHAKANPGKLTFGVGRYRHRHPSTPASSSARSPASTSWSCPIAAARPMAGRFPLRQTRFHLRCDSDHQAAHLRRPGARARTSRADARRSCRTCRAWKRLGLGSVDSTSEMGIDRAGRDAGADRRRSSIRSWSTRSGANRFRSRLDEQGFYPARHLQRRMARPYRSSRSPSGRKSSQAGNVKPE